MAENDSTASNATRDDAELQDIQDRLDQVMSNKDDKTKRRIFNQVLIKLTSALPNLPQDVPANDTKPTISNSRNLLDATEKLREAGCLAEFIQSISLNTPRDAALLLQPAQLCGFYYAMQTAIDRIKEAEALIDMARAKPEVLPA